MPFDSNSEIRTAFSKRARRCLFHLPAWAYLTLSTGGLLAAFGFSLRWGFGP